MLSGSPRPAPPRPARLGYDLGVVPSGAWHSDRSKSHESEHNPTQRVMAPTRSLIHLSTLPRLASHLQPHISQTSLFCELPYSGTGTPVATQ